MKRLINDGETAHRFMVLMGGSKNPGGAAFDAPPDPTRSPVRLRDLDGVVHTVVKSPESVWCYCDIRVMKDWLEQEGKNVVPDDTPVTCMKCLVGGHEG